MQKTITVDTNLLLDDANIIYKLSREYDVILIPRTVLKELDKHKYNPNLSYSARNAISSIRQFKEEHPNKIKFHIIGDEITNNDAWIIEATKQNNAALATKDISLSIIAEAEGIETKIYDVVLNNIFHPYTYITVSQIYEKTDMFEWFQYYKDDKYYEMLDLFSGVGKNHLDPNTWFFIFIQGDKESPYVYANNPLKKELTRIDNLPIYLEINCDRQIKARDIFQNCAIFALREAPSVLITGKWGSGKSLLASAYALDSPAKKAFITRPPIGINAKYNIGFVPGGKDEKMIDWLGGFTSALYYIYGNTNGQTDGRTSYNYVKDVIFNQKYEVLPLNSIQGLSLLENDILLVDEVQLLSVDYMSMLLSRPSESGKLVMMGDLKQTYSIVKPSESGLLKLLRVLPSKSLAYVDLENSYRSDLIKLADKLQDKTIL